MPHLNKSKKQMERMNKRHPQPEFQYSATNKINNLYKLNSTTNQISILAGPPKAAEEAT